MNICKILHTKKLLVKLNRPPFGLKYVQTFALIFLFYFLAPITSSPVINKIPLIRWKFYSKIIVTYKTFPL